MVFFHVFNNDEVKTKPAMLRSRSIVGAKPVRCAKPVRSRREADAKPKPARSGAKPKSVRSGAKPARSRSWRKVDAKPMQSQRTAGAQPAQSRSKAGAKPAQSRRSRTEMP